MKKITAEQVGKSVGVSRSAVSRSFSAGGRVSAETRRKVLIAAERLGYKPNGIASNLARRRSDIVALIHGDSPDIREVFFFQKLSMEIMQMGLTPLMISIPNEASGRAALNMLIKLPLFTAVVLADSIHAESIIPFCEHAPPIMMNNNYRESDAVDAVALNEASGIHDMVHHLTEKHLRTIWLISGRKTASAHQSRRTVLLEALAKSDIKLIDQEMGDFSYESGAAALKKMALRGEFPDAVFAANDMMAMGALDAARYDLQKQADHGIYFVGFDDLPLASWPSYNLSTIRQSDEDFITHVAEIIAIRRKEHPQAFIRRVVETTFIARE